ncbi:carbon monoxide dehydrogenase accessory protein CooC [Sodalis sp. dw_96]|uniref:ATP-binding protein n=1 Tax=Sodalis sp. dw_96 TaxID=2719794 RepID=UPI001BD5E5F0|nr:carbon monoxide dehydrogenase accessory protein CooC [Sodalis sp. dw_96]
MKIAIAGKGGVGKTTLAGLLARSFAAEGKHVLAIDADPDANLASALGIPAERYADLQPFSHMKDLAKERTGADSGYGGLFILNPKVDDLPDAFCVEHAGVRLLLMGTVEHGGTGCVCPEHTLLRSLMKHLLLERRDLVIMDMEAGIEHLGRSTAEAVDLLIVVVEPGQRSIQTTRQIEKLAADIGIKKIAYVGSKIKNQEDKTFLASVLPAEKMLGYLSLNEAIRDADRTGAAPYDIGGDFLEELRTIKTRLLDYAG